MSKRATGLGVGIVLSLLLPILLIAGNNAIDQAEPDRSTGLMFYGGVIFLFLAGLAIAWSLPGAPKVAEMSWILIGTIFGAFLAMIMEDYPYTFVNLAMPLGIGAGIGVLITWLVTDNGDRAARIVGATAGFAFFVAAMYHAITIDRQVELAAAAHRDTPGIGFALILGFLVIATIIRRRR